MPDGRSNLICVKNKDGLEVHKKIKHNCYPDKLFIFLTKLNHAQLESVHDIGFGGLTFVTLLDVPRGLTPWLIERFDPSSYVMSIGDDRFLLTGDDVYDIFMLPRNPGVEVPISTNYGGGKDDSISILREKFVEEAKGWSKIVGNKEVKLSDVEERLVSLSEGGDEFKRLFVLYVCGVFLAPLPTPYVDKKLLTAVQDVNMIRQYDWCSFVIDRLGAAVNSVLTTDFCSVSGCVQVLVYSYLQRFPFRGRLSPTELPLCRHWPDPVVHDRVDYEKKHFSFGDSLRSDGYPITKVQKGKGPLFYIPPERINKEKEIAVKVSFRFFLFVFWYYNDLILRSYMLLLRS